MKPRAAIAGAGLMGFWHAQTVQRIGGTVAAVFDLNAGAARRLADKFPGANAGTSLATLLTENKIDVLHICTPTATHGELAAAALARGIHVFAEKPMTPTAAETSRLCALASEHRVQLCPVHQFPFQRGVLKAHAALHRIGGLRHFEAKFCSAGGAGKSEAELDAIVADILPHPLSLMQRFTPGHLPENGWNVSRPAPGEFHATLKSGGIGFSILISMNTRPTATSLHLLGSDGTIHVDLFHGFCVIEPGAVSRWRKIIHPFDLATRTLLAAGGNLATRTWQGESAYPGLRNLTAQFYEAVKGNAAAPISGDDTLTVATVRDRLTRREERVEIRAPAPTKNP